MALMSLKMFHLGVMESPGFWGPINGTEEVIKPGREMLFRAGQAEALSEGEGQIGYFHSKTASEGCEELFLNYSLSG